MFVPLYMLILSLGHADVTSRRAICETRMVMAKADPFAVDPEDERAILDFIASVVPAISQNEPNALADTMTLFWRKYRPDLGAEALAQRVRLLRNSAFAMKLLRGNARGRRAEVGRLRLVWLDFLDDLPPPDVPRPTALLRHRAEILTVRQRAGAIVAYLNLAFGVGANLDPAVVAPALRLLYEVYLPDQTVPTFESVETDRFAREAEIVSWWSAYVETHAAPTPVKRSRLKLKFELDAKGDPSHIPDDARAMLEFMAERYPHIAPYSPHAVKTYVNTLRREFGLGPTRHELREKDFYNIAGAGYPRRVGALKAVWRELAQDRARLARPKRVANSH